MIEFACRCKHRFSFGEDMAGGVVQCPVCGLLNDVPTLDDLPHLAEDGTYDIEVERPKDDPLRIAQLGIFYAKGRRDTDGDEIDLRLTIEEVRAAGADPARLDPPPASCPAAPKYDPETGELIRAMAVTPQPEEETLAIPLAMPAIGYAMPGLEKRISFRNVFLDLFTPGNAVVLMIIFLGHIFFTISAIVVVAGLVFIFIAPLAVAIILVGHYGNVIDELGPREHDELPRPLRDCSWHEDIWGPFVHIAGAFVLTLLPWRIVLLLPLPGPLQMLLGGVALVAGLFFFPAVLLTLTTSGSTLNLRPDRVLGVVRVCGSKYLLVLLLWIAAAAVYGVGIVASDVTMLLLSGFGRGRNLMAIWAFSYPMLLAGIYLMHAFCWCIAILYRAHHHEFPWVLQRYSRERKDAAPAAPGGPRPRRATQDKLRDLREAQRRHQNERTVVDKHIDRPVDL